MAFEQVLASEDARSADLLPFYLSCGDYLLFSMDRLHHQDQLIHDYLKQRLPDSEREAHRCLDELNERQSRSRRLMAGFRDLLEHLRQAGRPGLPGFVAGARDFSSRFTALLAPRKNPFAMYTDRLFDADDWGVIAAVDDTSLAREAELFAAVCAAAPESADPESMVVRHS